MYVNRMGTLLRVKVRWSGFTGSPGYSVLHFMGTDVQTDKNALAAGAYNIVHSWANGLVSLLPAAANLQVLGEIEELAESTGEITNIIGLSGLGPSYGTAPASESFAGPAGAVVNWRTSGVRKGRRVHGKTFLVPLTSSAFENNGTLTPSALGTIATVSNSLINGSTDAPDFGVFCRPTTKGATDGLFFPSTTATVPDMAAILTSRRQ